MTKYHIYGTVTGSKYLGTVEADSTGEAEEKAWEELDCSVSVCYHCANDVVDPEITAVVANEVEDGDNNG